MWHQELRGMWAVARLAVSRRALLAILVLVSTRLSTVRKCMRALLRVACGGEMWLPSKPLRGVSWLIDRNRSTLRMVLRRGEDRFGSGVGDFDGSNWRAHLFDRTAHSMMEEVAALLGVEDPHKMALDEVAEGIRRCLTFLNPPLCAEAEVNGKFFSKEQCETLAHSLLQEYHSDRGSSAEVRQQAMQHGGDYEPPAAAGPAYWLSHIPAGTGPHFPAAARAWEPARSGARLGKCAACAAAL